MKPLRIKTWVVRWMASHPLLLACLAIFPGCTERETAPATSAVVPFHLRLQTDWFAQPEHGGYYQALARGFYAAEGIEVEIIPGGPNAMTIHKILQGRADLALNRADAILLRAAEGMPLAIVGVSLLHDPQAIVVHASSPVHSLADLDGREVKAVPGLSWIPYIERRYGIHLLIRPHDFGLEEFLTKPETIQQCLLTNEPYYLRAHGAQIRVLPLAESGFDPCHVLYARRDFAAGHRPLLRRFLSATSRGWEDYLNNDPDPAHSLIAARNPQMTPDFMAFVRRTLKDGGYVLGRPAEGTQLGKLPPERLDKMSRDLAALGLLPSPLPVEQFADVEMLRP